MKMNSSQGSCGERNKARARALYDRLSGIYSVLAASEAPVRRKACEILAAQPGERILEIGCGPGESLERLAQGNVQACGIDLSTGMARAARQRLSRMGLSGKTSVQIGDGSALPYQGRIFTGALMIFTLELFDDLEMAQVLAEVTRTLQPGGRLVVAAMVQKENPSAMMRAYAWFHERFPQWADCRAIWLGSVLEGAGFKSRQCWKGSIWGLSVEIWKGIN